VILTVGLVGSSFATLVPLKIILDLYVFIGDYYVHRVEHGAANNAGDSRLLSI
jgi:hypothetical protein